MEQYCHQCQFPSQCRRLRWFIGELKLPSWSFARDIYNCRYGDAISSGAAHTTLFCCRRCCSLWRSVIACPSMNRCTHLTPRKITGACIANILEISINYSSPTKFSGTPLQEILDGVGLFTTSALTMITTALIVYRIHSVSQPNLVKYPRSSYRRITDLLVQSAAAYSLVALIYAISSIIPGSAAFPSTEHQIPNVYLHAFTYEIFMIAAVRGFYFFDTTICPDREIQGMAPTIMVARIALESCRALNRQIVAHVSDLEFQEPNADLTVTQIPVPGGAIRGR